MARLILSFVARDPGGVAVSDEEGGTTWAELNDRANRLIHVLRRAGLQRRDRVAVHSGNRRELHEIAVACLHAGFYVLQTNWRASAEDLGFVLGDSDAKALIVDHVHAEVAAAAAEGMGGPALRLAMAGASPPAGFDSYEAALAGATPAESEDQVSGSAMFYTSGTTGRPKGVFPAGVQPGADVGELGQAAQAMRNGLKIPDDGRTLLVGPVYHSGQWTMSVYPLLCGVPAVLRRRPDPEVILDVIDAERVTHAVFSPFDFVRLLKLPSELRAAFDGSSLVQAAHTGAPCSPDIKRRMIEWWGPKISEIYGASEAGLFTVTTSEEWLRNPRSIGRVIPTLEMRIVTDDGRLANPGEPGVLHFRHLHSAPFAYHKLPEKTAEAYVDPPFFTLGDVGHVDESGYLYLADRKSEVIISGGAHIYPAEIEGVLAAHPAVYDVAVFGVPHPELGEEVKATVSVDRRAEPTAALAGELLAYAAERLAPHLVPRSIDFLDEIPRTDVGKLNKATLRSRYAAAG